MDYHRKCIRCGTSEYDKNHSVIITWNTWLYTRSCLKNFYKVSLLVIMNNVMNNLWYTYIASAFDRLEFFFWEKWEQIITIPKVSYFAPSIRVSFLSVTTTSITVFKKLFSLCNCNDDNFIDQILFLTVIVITNQYLNGYQYYEPFNRMNI